MKQFKLIINDLCNWLTWSRVIHIAFAFLIIKFLTNLIRLDAKVVSDFLSLFFFTFGIIAGIALTLSLDRRKASIYRTHILTKKEITSSKESTKEA